MRGRGLADPSLEIRAHLVALSRRTLGGRALPVALTALIAAGAAGGIFEASRLVPTATAAAGSPSAAPADGAGPTVTDAPAQSPAASAPESASRGRLPRLGPGGPDVSAPAGPRSWISVPSVHLGVAVVDYDDCTGNTPMTRSAAVHYLCSAQPVTVLVGHNPGVFSPLLGTHAGDLVTYRDQSGQRTLRLNSPVRVPPEQAALYAQDGSYTHMVLTTCAAPDSSSYWVFIAVPADGATNAAPPPGSGPGPGAPAPAPPPEPSPTPGVLGLPIHI
jgi:hypothetical protein